MGFYTYAGNAANWPGSVQLPLDNEKPKFSTAFAPGYEGLLDRTSYIKEGDTAFSGKKAFAGQVHQLIVPRMTSVLLADADSDVDGGSTASPINKIPRTLGGNRAYSLLITPTPLEGSIVTFVRMHQPGTGQPDANQPFVKRKGGATLATFPASAFGYVQCIWTTYEAITNWFVLAASPGVTVP